ncbi:nucleotidyltransferase domain-containing protein [bacterium]|nr:nucleotidyltransferase domain-containing protein [bacterium]
MNEQIKLLRDTIAGKFGAKQIFLFGSYASGKAGEESDIDLCVITDLKNKRKVDLISEIRRELIDRISSPLDILVYNEEEFKERARLRTTLEHKILSDGIKVYG